MPFAAPPSSGGVFPEVVPNDESHLVGPQRRCEPQVLSKAATACSRRRFLVTSPSRFCLPVIVYR